MSLRNPNLKAEWKYPAAPDESAPAHFEVTAAGPVLAPAPVHVEAAPSKLRRDAWLEISGVTSPKEELLELLSIAAEVEHALMVQYLYAMVSLDKDGSTATANLRGIVHDIALQEMAHLVSVQNLLLALGGPAALNTGRDARRSHNAKNPLPFALEPVSELILSEYVLAESPEDIPVKYRVRVKKIHDLVKAQANLQPHHVGVIYKQIYWILQPDDHPHGPLSLRPNAAQGRKPGWHVRPSDFTPASGIVPYQANPTEWNANSGSDMKILPVAETATSTAAEIAKKALENVSVIMAQGEGTLPGENTHFEHFLAALDMLAAGGISVLALPRTPFAGQAPPADVRKSTELKNPYVVLWAKVFNFRYTMLVFDIGLALAQPHTNADRGTLINWAFTGMLAFLRRLFDVMATGLSQFEACGPTFGLLLDGLPGDASTWWLQYLDLLTQEAAIHKELGLRPELANDSNGTALLKSIHDDSTNVRLPFVRQKLSS